MLHSETKTVKREYVTCDFCKKKLHRYQKCPGCGKDVCPQCGAWQEYNPWTGDYSGDYPPLVCDGCTALLKPLSRQASEIRSEADDKIEALRAEWQRMCLSAK